MTKPLHSLSPQELADQGIPVEVALRARIERAAALEREDVGRPTALMWRGALDAYREALRIIEAKR